MVKHYIKLDLSKRDERKIIPVSKSDTNTHKIIFTLTNGSEPIILPADVDAWVNVRNTASPIEKAAVNHADNTIEYTPSSDAFKTTGFVVSVLTISDTANRTLFSPTFYLYVEDIGSDITTVFNQAATTSAAGRNIATIMTAALDTLGTAKDDVQKHAENAEAWATGAVTVDKESVPVGEDKEQYNNNAKYYAEQANISAQTAQSSANDFEKFASSASIAAKTATEAKDATLAAVKNFTENLNPSSVSIELDHETYELTFKLLSSKGETLSQQLIDLPLESCVVGFDDFVDDNGKHYLRLKLRSGAETDIELDAIFANIQQKLNAKQNKLPENIGSSSHRMWAVSPQRDEFEKDGVQYSGFEITERKYNEFIALENFKDGVVEHEGKYYFIKPYYFKRLNAHDGRHGIITFDNYKEKAAELGWTEEKALSKVATHEEPTDFSVVARGNNGQIVVESGAMPYVAVNNKRLDARLEEGLSEVSPILHYDYHPTEAQRAKKDMRGWYRIAEASRISDIDGETEVGGGFFSNIFHINVQVWRSAFESDVVFTAERQSYSSGASLGVLSFASKNGRDDVIDKMRIVYYDAYSGEPGTANLKAYLEVHMNQNSTAEDAWDESSYNNTFYRFTTETLFRHKYCWKLITPKLVSITIPSDWSEYVISPLTHAWSQVTAPVDAINELPGQINGFHNTCVGLSQTIKAQAAQIAALEKFHNQSAQIVYPTEEQRANQDMTGWYRIAETSSAKGLFSDVFHLRTIVLRSNYSSDVVFTAERMNYMSDPSISILSFASAGGVDVIDKLRVVYVKNSTTEKTYLEVHINKNSPYSDAWDKGANSTGCTFYISSLMGTPYKWNIITPTLVSSELGANWTSYEKSPIDHAWNKVTATVDDINNLATRDSVDELKQIVDVIHPTMQVDLEEAAVVDYTGLSIITALKNALFLDVSLDDYYPNVFLEEGIPDDLWNNLDFTARLVPESFSEDPTSGTSSWTCNVTSIAADLGKYASSYEIKNLSAARGVVSVWPCRYDDNTIEYIDLSYSILVSFTLVTPEGREFPYIDYPLDCCLLLYEVNYGRSLVTALIKKNEETSIFSPSTYDLRTQSVDRRLKAAIEEARARREETRAIGETE